MISNSKAYTNTIGIEDGDVVDLDFTFTYDGEVRQEVQGFITEVSNQSLIQGFYEGLLGMKVEQDKEIVVSPEKGYTDPNHELYGKTLYFDVHINSIVEGSREDTFSSDTSTTETSTPDTPTLDLPSNLSAFLISLFILVFIRKNKTFINRTLNIQ